MNIIYEDKNLILIYKEAGIATQTSRLGEEDIVSRVKNHIDKQEQKKNAYVGIINRLDQPVEGIVLLAKDPQTAAALTKQMQSGEIKKKYYAVISGNMEEELGELINFLKKDRKTNLSVITNESDKDGKRAALRYRTISSKKDSQLLEIELLTGRHHQIRVQFAGCGHPLLGDRKYGTEESLKLTDRYHCKTVALCAYELTFKHPVSKENLTYQINPEHPLIVDIMQGDKE